MKLPKFTKSFYFLFSFFFLIWMVFIDTNDFYTQFKLNQKRKNLVSQKEYYQEKIREVNKERDELFSTDQSLEKFAREKYLMKKETEDLFIIVKKE